MAIQPLNSIVLAKEVAQIDLESFTFEGVSHEDSIAHLGQEILASIQSPKDLTALRRHPTLMKELCKKVKALSQAVRDPEASKNLTRLAKMLKTPQTKEPTPRESRALCNVFTRVNELVASLSDEKNEDGSKKYKMPSSIRFTSEQTPQFKMYLSVEKTSGSYIGSKTNMMIFTFDFIKNDKGEILRKFFEIDVKGNIIGEYEAFIGEELAKNRSSDF